MGDPYPEADARLMLDELNVTAALDRARIIGGADLWRAAAQELEAVAEALGPQGRWGAAGVVWRGEAADAAGWAFDALAERFLACAARLRQVGEVLAGADAQVGQLAQAIAQVGSELKPKPDKGFGLPGLDDLAGAVGSVMSNPLKLGAAVLTGGASMSYELARADSRNEAARVENREQQFEVIRQVYADFSGCMNEATTAIEAACPEFRDSVATNEWRDSNDRFGRPVATSEDLPSGQVPPGGSGEYRRNPVTGIPERVPRPEGDTGGYPPSPPGGGYGGGGYSDGGAPGGGYTPGSGFPGDRGMPGGGSTPGEGSGSGPGSGLGPGSVAAGAGAAGAGAAAIAAARLARGGAGVGGGISGTIGGSAMPGTIGGGGSAAGAGAAVTGAGSRSGGAGMVGGMGAPGGATSSPEPRSRGARYGEAPQLSERGKRRSRGPVNPVLGAGSRDEQSTTPVRGNRPGSRTDDDYDEDEDY
ncbi:MAG: hypothetical protein ACT4PP_15805 [Sporichthyaceae bacterium]